MEKTAKQKNFGFLRTAKNITFELRSLYFFFWFMHRSRVNFYYINVLMVTRTQQNSVILSFSTIFKKLLKILNSFSQIKIDIL